MQKQRPWLWLKEECWIWSSWLLSCSSFTIHGAVSRRVSTVKKIKKDKKIEGFTFSRKKLLHTTRIRTKKWQRKGLESVTILSFWVYLRISLSKPYKAHLSLEHYNFRTKAIWHHSKLPSSPLLSPLLHYVYGKSIDPILHIPCQKVAEKHTILIDDVPSLLCTEYTQDMCIKFNKLIHISDFHGKFSVKVYWMNWIFSRRILNE